MQGDLLPKQAEPWPDAAVETIRLLYPKNKNAPVARASIRRALDRIVAGEIDGKPRTTAEAIFFLRDSADVARQQMMGRLSQHIPHPSTYFNQSRYLRKELQDIPKDLGECVEILHTYPNGPKITPTNIDTYMPLLRTISECIESLHSTHGTAAASYIRTRVYRFAECVSKWPTEDLQFCPGPARFFKERRYDNDPRHWERKPTNSPRSEREQLLRVVGGG